MSLTCCVQATCQVGIDIQRLGTMMIVGQPRSNSEYIQASGRVGRGRKNPGLVLSLLRGSFPRDQSHYEMFKSFHQEFYRHVDVTSITPFSQRALERGMSTAMMMLFRMGASSFAGSRGAGAIIDVGGEAKAEGLVNALIDEVKHRIEGFEAEEMDAEVLKHSISIIQGLHRQTVDLARECSSMNNELHWTLWNNREMGNGSRVSLFASPYRAKAPMGDLSLAVGSMRDVAVEGLLHRPVVTEWKPTTTVPTGHLLSHAAPLNLWEFRGITYLTKGISEWLLDTPQGRNGALELIKDGGLRIDEPTIKKVIEQDMEFLVPPRTDENGRVHNFVKTQGHRWRMSRIQQCSCTDTKKAHLGHPNRQAEDDEITFSCRVWQAGGSKSIPPCVGMGTGRL